VTADPEDTRPRCRATSRSGQRCKRYPVPGATVCTMHGGAAPQVQAKAAERQLEAAADTVIRKLWPGLSEASPVKDPVASMERLAGALEQLVDEAGSRVSDLKHLAGGKDLTQLRAEVVLLERALGHLRGLLVDMARLGIAERQVEIEQEKARMVVQAFLGAVGLLALLPADKDLVVRKFLELLGRGPEVLEGEAS
jgi:hypothetical protein